MYCMYVNLHCNCMNIMKKTVMGVTNITLKARWWSQCQRLNINLIYVCARCYIRFSDTFFLNSRTISSNSKMLPKISTTQRPNSKIGMKKAELKPQKQVRINQCFISRIWSRFKIKFQDLYLLIRDSYYYRHYLGNK